MSEEPQGNNDKLDIKRNLSLTPDNDRRAVLILIAISILITTVIYQRSTQIYLRCQIIFLKVLLTASNMPHNIRPTRKPIVSVHKRVSMRACRVGLSQTKATHWSTRDSWFRWIQPNLVSSLWRSRRTDVDQIYR